MRKYKYICESCGEEQIYNTPEEAYQDGWDIPPYIGTYGVLSPRTCPYCTIENTVYWKVMFSGSDHLSTHDIEVITRIKNEPDSLMVDVE